MQVVSELGVRAREINHGWSVVARLLTLTFLLLLVFAEFPAIADAADPLQVGWYNSPYEASFSPNGDGQEETLPYYVSQWCSSRAANVTVVVRNAGGVVVRTLEPGVSYPEGCAYWSSSGWDGRNDGGSVVADGTYTVSLHAVAEDNSVGDLTFRTEVNTRIPGQLTAPAPGAVLSGTAGFVFAPTAGFSITSVSVGCLGESSAPGADGKFRGSGDTGQCSTGPQSLSASVYWTDQFGHAHGWASPGVPVTIDNPLQVGWYNSPYEASFSPNGDGQEETLPYYVSQWCSSRAANVTVVVRNAGGVVVRTLEPGVSYPEGCAYWSSSGWDGRNDGGSVVADGTYTVSLHAVAEDNSVGDLTFRTEVNTRIPGQLTAPAPGAVLSGTAGFVFAPTAGFSITSVSVGCLGESSAPGADGKFRGSGDTGQCSTGPQSLSASVYWTDQFGHAHGWASPGVPVTIDNPLQVGWYNSPYEASFSPNGDGQEETLPYYVSQWCSSRAANVTVVVRNAGGVVVRTLEPGVSYPEGCAYWSSSGWDGRNDGGSVVADGTYTVSLHAVAEDNSVGDLTFRTEVNTRIPGQLTAPAPGAVLSGTAGFVFAPTAGFSITSVSVGCLGESSAPGADGKFRGSGDTGQCSTGPQSLSASVYWTDQFGHAHGWASPGVPVTIDNPLQVGWYNSPYEASFSPNGDGQEETLPYYVSQWCSSRAANVTVVVRNAGGVVVRTLEPGVSYPEGCAYWSSSGWDGRNDGGSVVADGTYTVSLHAVAEDNSVGDLTFRTEVNTRIPGQLVEPLTDATLAGLAHFGFKPTSGVVVAQASACLATGECAVMYNASPDGIWRTTLFTGALTQGPGELRLTVTFVDQFGKTHGWVGPTIPVSIDTVTIPLEFEVEPITGLAPLATTFTITGSDPNGAPLAYTLNFGDGTNASGTIQNPYAPITLPHTYTNAGSFNAHVSVSNGAGGVSQKTVKVTASAPVNHAPTATLSVDPLSGVAPVTVGANVNGSDADDDPLNYTLDFGDGSAALSGSLPVSRFDHEYTRAGTFTVRLAVSDGQQTTIKTASVGVGLSESLAAHAGDDLQATIGDTVSFDGSASRPLVGIESYVWNFGDGSGDQSGVEASHVFTTTGVKNVTLTVRSGIQTRTDSLTVTVSPVPVIPGLTISVTDHSGNAIPAADVAVIDGSGSRFSTTSNGSGVARLDGLTDGSYTVYAWRDGYLPGSVPATVDEGSGHAEIELDSGAVAQTSLTADRLTPEEVQAAGIDPNDPANQNVYEFEIHLAFTPDPEQPAQQVSLSGYATGEGGSGGVGAIYEPVFIGGLPCEGLCTTVGEYTLYPTVQYVENQPSVIWMIIPGKAKWLKEFFDVRLLVSNLSSSAFAFQHGKASLGELPAGLSLAPTATPQALVQELADIPGGTSQEAHWLVRGDAENRYTLTGEYSGTLEPIGAALSLRVSTEPDALHVWGGSAVRLIVDTDDHAIQGAPYRIRVGLENVADVPVYNPQIELLTAGKLNYIYQPRERLVQGTAEIQPGEIFWADYVLIPTFSGSLVENLSFVKKTAGNVDPPDEIRSHPAPATYPELRSFRYAKTVVFQWDAVSGATDEQLYSTPDEKTDFPDTAENAISMGPTSARISGIADTGDTRWYALSPVIAAVPDLRHPIVNPSAGELYPKIAVSRPCSGSTVTATIEDPIFSLSLFTVTRRTATSPVTASGPLDGHSKTIQFAVDRLAPQPNEYELEVVNSLGEKASTIVQVRGCRYAALGDSFSAGEGASDRDHRYPEENDTYGPPKNLCHRTTNAYFSAVKEDLDASDTDVLFAACAGAVTSDVTSTVQYPGSNAVGDKTQLQQLENFGHADVITLTIGGNDAGFSHIIKTCALNVAFDCNNGSSFATNTMANVRDSFTGIVSALDALKQEAPGAEIYLLGYPVPVSPSAPDCPSYGLTAGPARFNLSSGERSWFVNDLAPYLNSVVEAAADRAGVHFVDESQALKGHEICTGTPWANGFVVGNDIPFEHKGPIGNESFHPNRDGQKALYKTLRDWQTKPGKGLIGQFPNPRPNEDAAPGPVPDSSMSISVFGIGSIGTAGVHLSIVPPTFAPSTLVRFILRSDPVDLGTATSAADGSVSFEALLPADTEPGLHTVEVVGTAADGRPQVAYALLLVGSSATDFDDDGVPDVEDNCALISNSAQNDDDDDGIGNACDPDYGETDSDEAPEFTSAEPPSVATVGMTYAYAFDASGSPPPEYSINSGQIPDGMSLTTNGLLAGTPTRPGRFTFAVSASNRSGTVIAPASTITVARPSELPVVVPDVGSAVEGLDGTTDIEVPVTLSNPSTSPVTVQWKTVPVPGAPGDQADPATDYTPATGTVTFAPGETSKTVTVEVHGDELVEPDEYIVVLFGNATNAKMGGFWGLGFVGIVNDDDAAVVPGVGSAVEGLDGTTDIEVPVTLSNPSTSPVTVQWKTVPVPGAPGDQADPATDYTPATGTVTFAPGETSKTVTVEVHGDELVEPDEYIVVLFGNATNAKMGGFWGLGFANVIDDDSTAPGPENRLTRR